MAIINDIGRRPMATTLAIVVGVTATASVAIASRETIPGAHREDVDLKVWNDTFTTCTGTLATENDCRLSKLQSDEIS